MTNLASKIRQVNTEDFTNWDKIDIRKERGARQRRKHIRYKDVILMIKCYQEDRDIEELK
jgi:hypothetical protein